MQSHIIFIDENQVFLDGLRKFFENQSNLQVHFSSTLFSLKELLSRYSPSKIIVDLKLVERAPVESATLLFEQNQKLILLTIFDNESYPHLQKKYGDIPIFCKTTSITQLIKTLKF